LTGSRDPIYPDSVERGDRLGFDIGTDLLCTADSDGRFTSLNAAWERVLGWSRADLMARPFIEFVHPDDVEATLRESARVADADYELARFENRYRTKDGDWRWLRWSAHADGTTWFAIAFDVTEMKHAEARLRHAFEAGSLLAYSQPIMDQWSRQLVQEELLARLRLESGEVALPAHFVPDAERLGLIGIVDRQMMASGLERARAGRPVEVNVSASSVSDHAIADDLVGLVAESPSAAGRVVFEITETAAIENLDAARDFSERMVSLGCTFALDDFGTGFGSLTHLRQLPVRYLKIDRSFVAGLTTDRDDQALVRSVVAIAREHGIHTVAEGVEDESTLTALGHCSVDLVQGYLIGHPRPLGPV
jgi:PAS domain S-box-containing protein